MRPSTSPLIIGVALFAAPRAAAYERSPELERVASVIALRNAEVRAEVANELLPSALAAHQRMVTLFPNYRAPQCRLPLWALPMSP